MEKYTPSLEEMEGGEVCEAERPDCVESRQERPTEQREALRGGAKIRVITDIVGYKEALERSFALLPEETEGTIITTESLLRSSHRTALDGLDDALQFAPDGKPVILLSFMPDRMLADDPRWQAAMSYPNVHSLRLPAEVRRIHEILANQELRECPDDPLARRLVAIPDTKSALGTLRHDLRYILAGDDSKRERWMQIATQLFGDKPFAELVELMESASEQVDTIHPLYGEEFPDLCVDVDGTLLDAEGEINQGIVERLQQESHNRPITIWSGGDLKAHRKAIRAAGLTWKVASKYQLRGATVDMAIDDLPEEEFAATYGVTVRNYEQV